LIGMKNIKIKILMKNSCVFSENEFSLTMNKQKY
jgi:hypothetical protein